MLFIFHFSFQFRHTGQVNSERKCTYIVQLIIKIRENYEIISYNQTDLISATHILASYDKVDN